MPEHRFHTCGRAQLSRSPRGIVTDLDRARSHDPAEPALRGSPTWDGAPAPARKGSRDRSRRPVRHGRPSPGSRRSFRPPAHRAGSASLAADLGVEMVRGWLGSGLLRRRLKGVPGRFPAHGPSYRPTGESRIGPSSTHLAAHAGGVQAHQGPVHTPGPPSRSESVPTMQARQTQVRRVAFRPPRPWASTAPKWPAPAVIVSS